MDGVEIQKQLSKPFNSDDIEWRVAKAGEKNGKAWAQVLAYVTARAIMDRLDSVFGIGGWKDEYEPGPSGGVLCKLSVKIDGEWICKQDVAENTEFEPVKGGVSGAIKRAAVKFGIGRYLYNLGVSWAEVGPNGKHYQPKDKKGNYQAFKWDDPELPGWALPEGNQRPAKPETKSDAQIWEEKWLKQAELITDDGHREHMIKEVTEATRSGDHKRAEAAMEKIRAAINVPY